MEGRKRSGYARLDVVKMAESFEDVPVSAASEVEDPSELTVVSLHPLKGFNNLRERYSEDTADVFFINKETKERLPAHREVLKVASGVFFKMFDGDWKEKEEKELSAPEEYKWESFKAAIALLYGEEVRIEEDFIVDVYRVAHCYDLKDVVYVLVQDICQWDSEVAAPMIKLAVLLRELETDKDIMQKEVLQAVMQYLARNLGDITGESLSGLSYEEVLMIVQLEDIKISEVDLLSRLTQWIKDHPDLTIVQGEKLLSHIRFGIIPYEALVACEVGHKNLNLALKHYHQPVEVVRENILQVTPRSCQKDIFQVFPVTAGLTVYRQGDTWKSGWTNSAPSVGLVYFGRQEVRFTGSVNIMDTSGACNFLCVLSNIFGRRKEVRRCEGLQESYKFNPKPVDIRYDHFRVIVNQTGAHLVLQCTHLSSSRWFTNPFELPFSGPFPWLLTFGVVPRSGSAVHSLTFTYPLPNPCMSDFSSYQPHIYMHKPILYH